MNIYIHHGDIYLHAYTHTLKNARTHTHIYKHTYDINKLSIYNTKKG